MEMITQYELSILDWIQSSLRFPILDKIMVFISALGNGGLIWIVLAVLFCIIKKYRYCGISVALSIFIGALFTNVLIKPFVMRIRPFNVNTNITLLIPNPSEFSFPSGHATAAFAGAVAVFLCYKKLGAWMLGFAFIITFSRLYLYVHFPTDVLAGAIIGTLSAIVAAFVVKMVTKKINQKKLSTV